MLQYFGQLGAHKLASKPHYTWKNMSPVFAAHSWPQSAVSLSHARTDESTFTPFPPVSDSIWSAARCLTFHARKRHSVHLSLQRHADFHLFDPPCHNIWTPRPDSSYTRSEPTICPGAYSSGVINTPLSYFAVINTRRIRPTKRDTFNGGGSPSSLQMLPLFHSQRCLETIA